MFKSPAALALASARADVTRLLLVVKTERADAKQSREFARNERINTSFIRAAARAERKAERVAKLEAKLAALKFPAVGVKAMRANRKPSKGMTVTMMSASA